MATVPKKSRAAVLVDYNHPAEIQEIDILDPEPGAIIAQVEASTVCGTDVHIFHGKMSEHSGLTLFSRVPLVMGHEIVGRIVELGTGRTKDAADQSLEEGDRIVWAYPWCGKCYYCTIALQPTLCPNVRMYGWGSVREKPYLTGGFAEYVYVKPECHVVKVPDGVDSKVAASATCAFRTVIHNFERFGGLGIQDNVVILGCGPVGLYALALSVVCGAGQVIMVGTPKRRLDLARKWGASHVIDIEEIKDPGERKEMIRKLTDGRGPDVVIECAGPSQAFVQGLDILRSGGRYLVIGQTDPSPISIQARHINLEMKEIVGAVSAAVRHFYKAMQFLKNCRDRFNFMEMLTNTYSLEQVNEALKSMEELKEIKPVILPNQ
ncbi:MAG: zinc-binding dehydrogenase [Deltaproteobacteria bacterium]|nr:zinc-binding dehydrogenase [Deltaproteobacteria bacterium]